MLEKKPFHFQIPKHHTERVDLWCLIYENQSYLAHNFKKKNNFNYYNGKQIRTLINTNI